MAFKELCEARYSCRAYKTEVISQEKLDYVFECARLAPSACNKQPWRLHYVASSEGLETLQSCYNREWLKTAPAIILVSVMKDEAWVRPSDGKNHCDIDASIIAEHICLAAAEQGLGTCWICNFDAVRCHALMNLAETEEPVVLLPIGIPADTEPKKKRKALEEFLK